MKKNFYAVRKGRKNNVIVKTWDECLSLVNGVSGAVYKGFQFIEEAERFAKNGNYGKFTPKPKVKQNKQWGECLERKSFTDPFTGQFYRNRCVVKHIASVIGVNYVDTGETSIPW